MSLFGKVLGKFSSEEKNENNICINDWSNLTLIEQLDEIVAVSKHNCVGIFKHSTRCAISKAMLKHLKKELATYTNLRMYYLDLLNYRSISNEIEYKFQIVHQSPQLLIIKEGKAIEHASHYNITQIDLQQFIK